MEEIKKITEEMRSQLKNPLPTEAVNPHPTKTYLSSIKAIYVTERLNDVFGVGSWRTRVEKESVGDKGMVVVKLIFEIPEYGVYHESYGGNDNGGDSSKNFDLGDAYKGASTDALTKICSYLEIGIDVFKGKGNKQAPTQSQPTEPTEIYEMTIKDVEKWNGKIYGKNTVYVDGEKKSISDEQIAKLKAHANYKPNKK